MSLPVMPSHAYYLNASFDLTFTGQDVSALSEYLEEMALWYLPQADSSDSIITDAKPPQDYAHYLTDLGLGLPKRLAVGERCSGLSGFPWGWNEEAVGRLTSAGATCDHPDLPIVKLVNSRSFSVAVRQSLGCDLPGTHVLHCFADVKRYLATNRTWPLVAKPEFGNTGMGFAVVRSSEGVPRTLGRIRSLFEAGNPCVTLEPWLPRRMDLSTRFDLDRDGRIDNLRCCRTLVTPQGASYGMVTGATDARVTPWVTRLQEVACQVGAALHAQGYWGPVNIDAMVALVDGQEVLFPLLEINARQSLSFVAYALHERLGRPDWFMLRTLGQERHCLPPTYEGWRRFAGDCAYNPGHRHGAICLTPLRLQGSQGPRPPHRSIFCMSAASEEALKSLDDRLTSLLRGECQVPNTELQESV